MVEEGRWRRDGGGGMVRDTLFCFLPQASILAQVIEILYGVPIGTDEHSTNIRWRGHCVCAWEGRKVHVDEYMLA